MLKPRAQYHVVTTVVITDEHGATYERTYVGMPREEAVVHFADMIADDNTAIDNVEWTVTNKCWFPTYDDYVEDLCVMCSPSSFPEHMTLLMAKTA